MRFGRLLPTVTVAALLAVSTVTLRSWSPQTARPSDAAAAARVLQGTIDIHVHSAPDNVPRSIDGLDVAKLARTRGMRGIVLKNHYEPTASLAFLARKEAPGLEVFGGSTSAAEALLLLREGRQQGVTHLVVTHAMNAPILMDVLQMQEAARLGAFIEFAGSTMANASAAARVDRFADAIRKVGPQYCILSSDLGQEGNPVPPDGFADFLVAMRAKGFSQQDIDTMAKTNPARLLRLQ